MINKKLLKIIVCPACKGKFIYTEQEELLICKDCNSKYEVKNGIPLLLKK